MLLIAGTAALCLLALPGAASASIFCVDVTGVDCDALYNDEAGFAAALTAAEANSIADTVRLGPHTYSTQSVNPDGFSYADPESITIDGAGTGSTKIVMSPPAVPPGVSQTFIGLELDVNPGELATVKDLKITMPTPPDAPDNVNQHYRGIIITGKGQIENVVVDGPPGVGINGFGITLTSGLISGLTMDLPQVGTPGLTGIAASAVTPDDLTIEDTQVKADAPVDFSNPGAGELFVRRSVLRPFSGYGGVSIKAADGNVEDTIIDLGGLGAFGVIVGFANPAPHTSTAAIDGVTIANGGAGSEGIRARTDTGGTGDTISATVRNTIIDQSVDMAIDRQGHLTGGSSNVSTAYSNYDAASNLELNDTGGTGSITATNTTNLNPAFVGPTDFHLQAASPLIEAGDPAAPAPGTLDVDGDARMLLGKPACAARRDIGADEFAPVSPLSPLDCLAPDTSASGRSKVKSKKKRARLSFTLGATEAGSTFECSLDGAAFAACTSPFSATARRGAHTLRVRAKDASGNLDQSPASFAFQVVKKKPKKK